MKPLVKGVLLAVLQIAIVLSLGGKMLYDRATRPRVWVKTAPVDPDLPLRGRYVSLRLEVQARNLFDELRKPVPIVTWRWQEYVTAELRAENGQLIAVKTEEGTGVRVLRQSAQDTSIAALYEPVAFFIPENIPDPSRRAQGEELWVEVTVPKKGPPRPIRLGVKKDGKLSPLEIN